MTAALGFGSHFIVGVGIENVSEADERAKERERERERAGARVCDCVCVRILLRQPNDQD